VASRQAKVENFNYDDVDDKAPRIPFLSFCGPFAHNHDSGKISRFQYRISMYVSVEFFFSIFDSENSELRSG
jgi:hypothetical protein